MLKYIRNNCGNCGHIFQNGELVFYATETLTWRSKKPLTYICQKCSRKENITVKQYLDSILENKLMSNIKITAEVDGKIVPLNTISTETFEAIKALKKPKEIPVPVARVGSFGNGLRLFLTLNNKLKEHIAKDYVRMISIDLKTGNPTNSWEIICEDLSKIYGEITIL